jgi:hypothetical protein
LASVREQATFYRAALLLGLVRGEEIVRWADAEIAHMATAPATLCEIAMIPHGDASDVTTLRAALLAIADARESPAVVDRLLSVIADDFRNGRRNARATITVLGQLRGNVALSDELREALHPFGIQNILASVGAERSIEDVETRLKNWLVTR